MLRIGKGEKFHCYARFTGGYEATLLHEPIKREKRRKTKSGEKAFRTQGELVGHEALGMNLWVYEDVIIQTRSPVA